MKRQVVAFSLAIGASLGVLHCDAGEPAVPGRDVPVVPPAADSISDAGVAADADAGPTGPTCIEPEAGAPIVDGGDADGGDGGIAPTFTNVWTTILEVKGCTGCHGTGGSGKLSMPDKCSAWTNLREQKAQGAACGSSGLTRVVPGDPNASLLVQKVEGPSCGSKMPIGGSLDATQINLVRAWIAAGANYD